MKIVEFRIRPVTRYIVTRFERCVDADGQESGGCETLGELDHFEYADKIAAALHKAEPGSTYPTPTSKDSIPSLILPGDRAD